MVLGLRPRRAPPEAPTEFYSSVITNKTKKKLVCLLDPLRQTLGYCLKNSCLSMSFSLCEHSSLQFP